MDSGFEIFVAALVVEIVETVFVGSDERDAVVAGDFTDREFGGWLWWCDGEGRWFFGNGGSDGWEEGGGTV